MAATSASARRRTPATKTAARAAKNSPGSSWKRRTHRPMASGSPSGRHHADARPQRGARRPVDGHRRPRADQGPVLTRTPLADGLHRRLVSQRTAWWEGLYATSDVENLPWYTPDLDKDFERAL